MNMKTINLVAGNDRDNSYGIRLVSETEHDFTGKGIHNRYHSHTLQVWENGAYGNPDTDPSGNPFTERYSYLWSPNATVITAHKGKPVKRGEVLALNDEVELTVNGFSIGHFRITAKPHHNPHMVKID